ncbi:MAG: hypothetical protein F6K63_29300 [Moorea sp. SIO1G6]|uniref:hypothetical protein n=1 Tax=Moorena sp. SIO1G6 TaxID=2607840 RepID=UPI0013C0E3F7|nr:hypothetical protein [Moorena sp. SIO1G6]NET68270.1 hypothetical protein [Moorena sp. SIO1G6]
MPTNNSDNNSGIKPFSTSIYLKDRQGNRGIEPVFESNSRLEDFMAHLVESEPDRSEAEWAACFLYQLRQASGIYRILSMTNPPIVVIRADLLLLTLSDQLLFNYLQFVCWSAAQAIAHQLSKSHNLALHYPVEECFIIASAAASNPAKLLRGFNFYPKSSIYAYAFNALKRIIRNQVAKELRLKSIKFSDYGLLRYLDKTELEQALNDYGITNQYFNYYRLAWQSFKDYFNEMYPPSSKGNHRHHSPIKFLTQQQLNQIALRYNQQLNRLNKLVSSEFQSDEFHRNNLRRSDSDWLRQVLRYSAISTQHMPYAHATRTALSNQQSAISTQPSRLSTEHIEEMLAICIQAVRMSQQRNSVSLDEYGEITDIGSNPLEVVIQEEEKDELTQVRSIILKEFTALDQLAQKSLRLWLGLGINQQDFIELFGFKKQYQVARQFQRYFKRILKAVVTFYFRDAMSKNITSKDINQHLNKTTKTNYINNYLKSYLSADSKELFAQIIYKIYDEIVDKIITTKLSNLEKKQLISSNQILRELIQPKFEVMIEERFAIKLINFRSAKPAIAKFIERWLQQNQALIEQSQSQNSQKPCRHSET